MKLKSIKVGMKYQEVRNNVSKSNNLIISNFPMEYSTSYIIVKDFNTKEQIYIKRDFNTGIITNITTDINKIKGY